MKLILQHYYGAAQTVQAEQRTNPTEEEKTKGVGDTRSKERVRTAGKHNTGIQDN